MYAVPDGVIEVELTGVSLSDLPLFSTKEHVTPSSSVPATDKRARHPIDAISAPITTRLPVPVLFEQVTSTERRSQEEAEAAATAADEAARVSPSGPTLTSRPESTQKGAMVDESSLLLRFFFVCLHSRVSEK